MAGAPIPASLRRGYSLGSVATGTFGTVPGLLLLPYLTDTVGIPAILAGLIVFVPKGWDVVCNPIAGRVSDRFAIRRLTRRPFLLYGGIGLAVCFALLFGGPTVPKWGSALWVLAAFVGCATFYAFFQTPYVAMPAEITDDYTERTELMTWRVAVLALAILVSGGSAPAVQNAIGGVNGYRAMGIWVALLILLGTLGSYFGTRKAPPTVVRSTTGSFREQMRIVSRSRDFRRLLATFVVQALAVGAMLAGVDYLARDVLDRDSATTVLFVCFVGPAVLVTPLWQRFGTRWGKKAGYVASSLVLLAGVLALVATQVLPLLAVYGATACAGAGYAGIQAFPLAMLPDTAAVDAMRTGQNRVGVFTGVWSGSETLGLAIGPGLYAIVLAIGGYVSSTAGVHVIQPASALTAITLGFSLLPAILIILSLIPLSRYRLGPTEVAEARQQMTSLSD